MSDAALNLFLLIGGALSLLYLVEFCWKPASPLKTFVKTGAVAIPALGLTISGAPLVPLAGLWACALGDYLLARDGERTLMAGIGAFALGHILYVAGFFQIFEPEVFTTPASIAVPLVLILLGLSTEKWLQPHTAELRGPVRIYVGLILIMGCVAAQQPIPQTTVFWGALAFILSDLLLSVQIFIKNDGIWGRLGSHLVWLFYYLAQVLIFYGFIA